MDEYKTVVVVGTEEEAAVIVGFLENEGIRVRVHSLLFKQEPVNFGGLGDVRVQVVAEDVDRAREALERAEKAAAENASDLDDEKDDLRDDDDRAIS